MLTTFFFIIEFTPTFIKKKVQYKCIPNNTNATLKRYLYSKDIIYHSSVGKGLFTYTFANRQKGKIKILKYIQIDNTVTYKQALKEVFSYLVYKYPLAQAMNISLISWIIRIIIPGKI
jgi:hypothetical protein